MASPPRVRLRPSLQEFGLIRTLKRRFERTDSSIKHGIGDDAAVLAAFPHTWTLLTTDLLTEGVHFERRTASFVDIGFRAAAANLSDIAAMGGTPRYVLVALAIPAKG
ncbi:MAG TPA: AIR synthase related protein, partial [Nitrospira sp.]